MEKESKIYVAGHLGMVGSAIVRNLKQKGYTKIIGRTFDELNLINQHDVLQFFSTEKPDYVFLAAAKVGGIVANSTLRAQFIYENLMIQNNIIHSAHLHGVKKLMFLGSSCIYPRLARQPITEAELLTGLLEPTNEPYAIAKIAGIKMCDAYRAQYGSNFVSVMPTNLYGEGDNYNLETSHVLPALIRKVHLGKCLMEQNWEAIRHDLNKRPIEGISGNSSDTEILQLLSNYGISFSDCALQQSNTPSVQIELWGTGSPLREFLNADDMADATVYVMENYNEAGHVNVGSSEEHTIKQMAELICTIVGYKGTICWNSSKPDGMPRKLMDSSRLYATGWKPKIGLKEGLETVYRNYVR